MINGQSIRKSTLGLAVVSALTYFPQSALAQNNPSPSNPSYQTQTKFGYVHITKNLVVDGTTTSNGAVTQVGNFTVTGTITSSGAMQAPSQILTGTSFNATLVATPSLAQATTYTIPDPTASTDTFATLGVANAFTGNNTFAGSSTFPAAGIILKGTSFNATLKALAALGQATTYTLPDPVAATDTIATLGAANTFSGTNIFSTALQTASVNHAIKSKVFTAKVCPAGGAVTVNGTTYFQFIFPGRAWTVKQIGYATHVDPISGTNTIKVLKATSAGNTMLSTANVSLNGTTIDLNTVATLTATSGDLTGTATQPIYCEYAAGTQGAVAKDVTVEVEVEFTDY